jgi:hypothetical protein
MKNNLRKKYNFIGPTTGEYTGKTSRRTPGEHTRRTPFPFIVDIYIYHIIEIT